MSRACAPSFRPGPIAGSTNELLEKEKGEASQTIR